MNWPILPYIGPRLIGSLNWIFTDWLIPNHHKFRDIFTHFFLVKKERLASRAPMCTFATADSGA